MIRISLKYGDMMVLRLSNPSQPGCLLHVMYLARESTCLARFCCLYVPRAFCSSWNFYPAAPSFTCRREIRHRDTHYHLFLRISSPVPCCHDALQGILNPQDAVDAIEAGADGMIVSNHGGRALDGALSSIESLGAVVKVSCPFKMYHSCDTPQRERG